MKKISGFTLIELLIVVAIIAILAAIAIPNFLEAQTRSKVSRVKADQRALATAIEAYRVDCNIYPMNKLGGSGQRSSIDLVALTTPVAFMSSSNTFDPFNGYKVGTGTFALNGAFGYFNYQHTPGGVNQTTEAKNWIDYLSQATYGQFATSGWCLSSWGPDRAQSAGEWYYICMRLGGALKAQGLGYIYDPTNGTVSSGDILRFGGDTAGVAAP